MLVQRQINPDGGGGGLGGIRPGVVIAGAADFIDRERLEDIGRTVSVRVGLEAELALASIISTRITTDRRWVAGAISASPVGAVGSAPASSESTSMRRPTARPRTVIFRPVRR